MTEKDGEFVSGLEDVIAARTELSFIDGDEGVLIFRGEPVEEIARDWSFADVCRLFWEEDENLADISDSEIESQLAKGRQQAFERLQQLGYLKDMQDGMQAIQASVATLELDEERNWRAAARLTGMVPTFATAWWRLSQGNEPVSPNPDTSHVPDILRMGLNEVPEAPAIDGLRTYLVSVADHGLNASTFTARVIASTQSSLPSAVSGAIGALKGPLHGGAPGPVLEMIESIAAADSEPKAWLEKELDEGRRIMGMGHRVYQIKDPRAKAFENAAERMGKTRPDVEARLELARQIESDAKEVLESHKPGLDLYANVEFYTAVLLDSVGLPSELFSLMFASGRSVGWAAHVLEQWRRGRLIRPRAEYDGPSW